MKLPFSKYQGTGNDFVLIDDRDQQFDLNNHALIKHLCDRRFGVGADGLMLLRTREGYDFEMIYYNADGRPSSMCGNGGRCISRFASDIGLVKKDQLHFLAVDGPHEAVLSADRVKLKMQDVNNVEIGEDYFWLDTGSPHYVKFVLHLDQLDVVKEGRSIRYNERFSGEGTNVNFVQVWPGSIRVRTYERGVEDETLSCGTGVTASALAAALKGVASSKAHCEVKTRGGELNVYFSRGEGNAFSDIWLEGPAVAVYSGAIHI
jgi:diaminopimelate epimerase